MTVRSKPVDSNFKTFLFSSAANLAAPLSTLITGPLLARALGPDGRGIMAALFAPLALANLMFTLGVPDALTYFVAGGRLAAKKAIQIALGGGSLCAAAACSALLISEPYLFRNQKQWLPSFNLLLLSLPVTLAFSAIRGIIQGRRQFSLINKERVSGAVLRLFALAGLVSVHLLTPMDAVWVSVASGAIGSLFLFPGLLRDIREPLNSEAIGPVAHYAGAAALGTVGGLLVIRLDQVLMVSLTTHAELAYYAVAASLSELPLTVVSASRDMAFSMAAERDDPRIIARFCRLTVLSIGIICASGALATPIILPLLFGRAFSPAIGMAEILLAGTVGRAVTTVIGAGLMTTGATWLRSVLQLGGAALTAALLFAFVPRWGGIGAAWVTTLTYAALALASLLVYVQSTGLSLRQCLVPMASDIHDLKSMAKLALQRPL